MKMIYLTKRIFMLMLVSLMSASCESWLSVSPSSELKYDDLFSTRNGFKDQLTGIYTSLCSEALYGANLTYGMVDALGQNYYWKLELGKYYYLSRFEYGNPTASGVISEVWNSMYNTVANVNILLQGIHEFPGVLGAEEERIYEGEAYAIRAMLHFDLLRLFGKSHVAGRNEKAIPYVTSISKHVTPLSTVEEVADLALADLKRAESLLEADPVHTGEPCPTFLGNRSFHFNYYAVKALMARIHLFKGDKANALAEAEAVIGSGKYPWVEQDKVTTTQKEDRDRIFVTEGIFILNNTKLNDLTAKFLREGLSDNRNDLLVSTDDVLGEIFETDMHGGYDWRYTYFFEKQQEIYQGSIKLWQFDFMPDEYRNRQPLLRISEMYLIAAECATDKAAALEYFNTLRRHRGFDPSHDLEAGITDAAFAREIGKEYRKEFFGEGQWFFYCKRKDLDNLPDVSVPFGKGFYVLPIPDVELEYGNRN